MQKYRYVHNNSHAKFKNVLFGRLNKILIFFISPTQPFSSNLYLPIVINKITTMKKIVFGILIATIFAFTACSDNDDGYSLNDMWVGFGVLTGDEPGNYNIVMDNKDVLVPAAASYPGWQDNFNSGDRVLVNYTILGDDLNGSTPRYYVKVNNIEDVLMKGIMEITPEIEDSIGSDPLIVEDYWMTDSLLSFKLKYWGLNETHFLNLVREPGELTGDDQPIQLELRHNANDDEKSILYTAFVSFSLNSLRINELDSVQFEFLSSDYDGESHSDSGVFNYEDLYLP